MTNLPLEPAEMLTPVERLAIAYASFSARPAWEALLFFHHRLAEAARPDRDPLMIQLRLSWWRDRLSEPAGAWPKGEPVLAALGAWTAETGALCGLVDGWEARIVGEDGGAELARAEIEAYVALARIGGVQNLDLIRSEATALAHPSSAAPPISRLPKAMRPLSIFRVLAMREQQTKATSPLSDFAAIVRVGLFGR